jgi:GH25 family lysozyme M1 (1,4-beta-N-acetylmuramidase)
MKKKILPVFVLIICCFSLNAQQCINAGFCTISTNQYPTTTFSTTSSSWTTVSAFMNAGNYTLFNVTSGNVYEWSYCEAYGGVSAGWDAQLTLSNNGTSQSLCFSDNTCGSSGNAPYISWTANFTGVVKVLTTVSNCASNTGSPYNTLVWRQANGGAATTILGCDVSHYDGTINWTQVKTDAQKIQFAWAKASEGTTITDATFAANMVNGNAAGVVVGGYHFGHPETNTAAAEASFFLGIAGNYIKSCYLPPILDLEDPAGGPSLTATLSSATLTAWVQAWMTAVKNQTGIAPVLYTNGSIATYLSSSVKNYGLWIADPDGSSTAQPTNIGGWPTWMFKQYSWTGTVAGISSQLDMNVFNGNMTAFNNLIGCTATGIVEKSSNSTLRLYPNPANSFITVEVGSFSSNSEETIAIYSMMGQLVFQQVIQQEQTEIDISGFSRGMYVVRVKTENGPEIKKFLKE